MASIHRDEKHNEKSFLLPFKENRTTSQTGQRRRDKQYNFYHQSLICWWSVWHVHSHCTQPLTSEDFIVNWQVAQAETSHLHKLLGQSIPLCLLCRNPGCKTFYLAKNRTDSHIHYFHMPQWILNHSILWYSHRCSNALTLLHICPTSFKRSRSQTTFKPQK